MGSWLNYLFSGSVKEQHCKLSHFAGGLDARVSSLEKEYSVYVIDEDFSDADRVLKELHEMEAQATAIKTDPRTAALFSTIDKEAKEKRVQEITKALREVLS